jgi:hypothetical protein
VADYSAPSLTEIGSISSFTQAWGPGSGWDDSTFDGSELLDAFDSHYGLTGGDGARGWGTHSTS